MPRTKVTKRPVPKVRNCVKCDANNFLKLCSRACDSNYFQWNNLETKSGYMDTFSSITESDGCNFSICIECGWIVGLELEKLKSDVVKSYQPEEEQVNDPSEDDGPIPKKRIKVINFIGKSRTNKRL